MLFESIYFARLKPPTGPPVDVSNAHLTDSKNFHQLSEPRVISSSSPQIGRTQQKLFPARSHDQSNTSVHPVNRPYTPITHRVADSQTALKNHRSSSSALAYRAQPQTPQASEQATHNDQLFAPSASARRVPRTPQSVKLTSLLRVDEGHHALLKLVLFIFFALQIVLQLPLLQHRIIIIFQQQVAGQRDTRADPPFVVMVFERCARAHAVLLS